MTAAALANNSVFITDGSSVPSFTTTLPSGLTLPSEIITTPSITGGSHVAITTLGIRSTTAAFDLDFVSTESLTANRSLTITLNDAARILTFGGNVTFGNAFTTGANALTLTTNKCYERYSPNFGHVSYIGWHRGADKQDHQWQHAYGRDLDADWWRRQDVDVQQFNYPSRNRCHYDDVSIDVSNDCAHRFSTDVYWDTDILWSDRRKRNRDSYVVLGYCICGRAEWSDQSGVRCRCVIFVASIWCSDSRCSDCGNCLYLGNRQWSQH